MTNCSFRNLVLLLDHKLDLDGKLEVLEHLDRCPICRDAIYQIARDRDEALFLPHPRSAERIVA